MAYREYICEMVNKITAEKTLKRIHKFVMYLWVRDDTIYNSSGLLSWEVFLFPL